jgi:hypothetical protein
MNKSSTIPFGESAVGSLTSFTEGLISDLRSSFKSVWIPGIILQTFAAVLVVGWFFVPSLQPYYINVAAAREQGGLLFSATIFAVAGGVIPMLMQALRGERRWSRALPDSCYLACAWFLLGIMTDLMYRVQSACFGTGYDTITLIMKTACDQFLWTPLVALPFQRFVYGMMEQHYNFDSKLLPLHLSWFRQATPNLILNWLVWIPAVAFMYMLPEPLQVPFAAIMVCFYSLLMMSITKKYKQSQPIAVQLSIPAVVA